LSFTMVEQTVWQCHSWLVEFNIYERHDQWKLQYCLTQFLLAVAFNVTGWLLHKTRLAAWEVLHLNYSGQRHRQKYKYVLFNFPEMLFIYYKRTPVYFKYYTNNECLWVQW
jgi:hypothetical protein